MWYLVFSPGGARNSLLATALRRSLNFFMHKLRSTANYLPTLAIGFTNVHVSSHSFPALYMAIPAGLLVSPIHSGGIHHDKCSSLSKLLPTTPAG